MILHSLIFRQPPRSLWSDAHTRSTIGGDQFHDNGQPQAVAFDSLVTARAALQQPLPLRFLDAGTVIFDPQPQARPGGTGSSAPPDTRPGFVHI